MDFVPQQESCCMALPLAGALDLTVDCRKRNIYGRALTLGKQDCSFTVSQLLTAMTERELLGADRNAAIASPDQQAVLEEYTRNGRLLSGATSHDGDEYVSDEFFFRFIGFDSIQSVDQAITGGAYEGASIAFDLNYPGLGEAAGQNQLVYDGGTMEHVFNTNCVFRNIFEALAVGGYIVHNSPTNNTVDHGFYQFSPTLFLDYYATNGYGDIEVYLTRAYGGRFDTKGHVEEYFGGFDTFPRLARYSRNLLNAISYGGLDSAIYGTQCYAKKLATSTYDRIPQQGCYVPLWDAFGNPAG
jgi:hypothetical protein